MSPSTDDLIRTIRTMLRARLAKSGSGSVALAENLAPRNDKYADYLVVYETVVTPQRLDQARLELWVTDKGHLTVGLEKRGRVAERIGIRTGSPHQFIGGHEALAVPIGILEWLLAAAANGALMIRARHAFGRLVTATADISALEADTYEFRDYAKSLRIGFDIPFGVGVDLAYQPW